MMKRVLFSFALMVTFFSCWGMASIPVYRLKFTINSPFLLEAKAQFGLPAGEYWVKDIGTAAGHVLSLERGRDRKHLAYLNTVSIDRSLVNFRDEPRAEFDLESGTLLPVIKKLYIPGTDGYEVLSAIYDNSAKFIDIAVLSKTVTKVTEHTRKKKLKPSPRL